MILYVFLAGAASAVLAAVPQFFLYSLFAEPEHNNHLLQFLLPFAFIEELAKFLLVFLVIKKSRYFDERIDAMIYMITAGLGFAALENMLNLIGTDLVVQVTLIRGIGATLLHALASGFLGYYWAKNRLVFGLIVATLLHWVFNLLILQLDGMEIYASIFLAFAAVILLRDFNLIKRKERA